MLKKSMNVLFGQEKMMLFNKYLVAIWLNILTSYLKLESYLNQQVNIFPQHLLSVQCAININQRYGNAFFVKK